MSTSVRNAGVGVFGLAVTVSCAGVSSNPRATAAGTDVVSRVSFSTPDSGVVHALELGRGNHAVILGSNGCGAKESWEPEARAFAAAGFRALAIDFRGNGQSRAGGRSLALADSFHFDILGAVRYLRATGARRVSVVGASCAGDAAAQAAVEAQPDEIDNLVLLAFGGIPSPERMRGRKLFVVTRDDANDAGLRLPTIRGQYERSPGPKEFLVLEGAAHAQRIFRTAQGDALRAAILRFLAEGR